MKIIDVETAAGEAWVTCRDDTEASVHQARSRSQAIAELNRLGRPPPQNDSRTTRELWDDVKGRAPAQAAGRAR